MIDLDALEKRADGMWEYMKTGAWSDGCVPVPWQDVKRIVALARAGRRHYEEHMDCNEECTCEEFVKEWREADA